MTNPAMKKPSQTRRLTHYLGFLTLALTMLAMPALAQASISISLTLDKSSYVQGNNVGIKATVVNGTGSPVLSTTKALVEIKKPNGVTAARANLTNLGNGLYAYTYALPTNATIGSWTAKVSFVSSQGKGTKSKGFAVATGSTPDPNTVDNDGDGYNETQGDCNDASAAVPRLKPASRKKLRRETSMNAGDGVLMGSGA